MIMVHFFSTHEKNGVGGSHFRSHGGTKGFVDVYVHETESAIA